VRKPAEHWTWFGGGHPCDKNGVPLELIIQGASKLTQGVNVEHMLSTKPVDGLGYPNYHAKMTTYVKILLHEAQAIDPTVVARIFPVLLPDAEDDSPFKYLDSSSSRAGIEAISYRLAIGPVGIVGLGGTGAYVLDLVAKTRAKEIHLFRRRPVQPAQRLSLPRRARHRGAETEYEESGVLRESVLQDAARRDSSPLQNRPVEHGRTASDAVRILVHRQAAT